MTRKDHVIQATDKITDALRALVRINYDNDKQAHSNITAAFVSLQVANTMLERAMKKEEALSR